MTTTPPPFVQRLGNVALYVLPASVLSDDPVDAEDPSSLRGDASRDGESYIQVLRPMADGISLARVAASPDRLPHGYTVLLTEHHLSFTRPHNAGIQADSLLVSTSTVFPVPKPQERRS